MIEEIQKRPFVRPLFLWITGILLYVSFPTYLLGSILSFLSCLILFPFWFLKRNKIGRPDYGTRWVWGAVCSVVTISLAILVSYCSDRLVSSSSDPAYVYRIAAEIQRSLVESFDRLRLSEEEKSVLATLTLGYRQTMSWEMRTRFSLTGVSHMLSVSGFHVAILCGALSWGCSLLPKWGVGRWIRYALLITSLWAFAFITGLAPSAIRAAIMLSLYLTGRVLRRGGDGYNTLAASAFCMLAYNPFYLFDIGFQLSYLAVLFILLLAPRLKDLLEIRNPLLGAPWGWVTVSVAAQAGTALLCGYYFGQFPLLFLFTNIPVTILASCLIPGALLWLALPEWIPGCGILQGAIEMMLRGMVRIVELFSEVPGAAASFQVSFLEMLGGYGVIILCLIYLKCRTPRVLLAALSLVLLLLLNILIRRYLLFVN